MKNIACIEDLRALARRKVPKAFFEYVDGGSYNEETLRANRAELEPIKLRQRVMVDVSQRSLATTIIGQKVSAPFALAPIGLCGMIIGVAQVIGMNPTLRSFFSMGPPLAKTSLAVFSGKNCDSAASAVEPPRDCRKARRAMSFGKSARITVEATTFS